MSGPDEIRRRWREWKSASSAPTGGPAPVGELVGDVLEKLERENLARRWRLHGREREALANLARILGEPPERAKLYLAHLGLCLARAEHSEDGERAHYDATLARRAIYHARRALADSGPPPSRFVPLATETAQQEAVEEFELASKPYAPGFSVEELSAIATAPQERELIDAFLAEGCSTLADVQRLRGWSKGHAATIARRLREKARRRR